MRELFITLPILLAGISAGAAEPLEFVGGPERMALVELYTSEGCSSCPPADRWLGGLRDAPGLWTSFAPLALHVDYWDYLGWRDRFARAAYGERQRRYARSGAASTVYTPGVFVNGREWRGWYGRGAPSAERPVVGRLAAEVRDRTATLTFTPAGGSAGDGAALRATVAVLGMGIESRVAAGENEGRRLTHDFVVLGDTSGTMRAAGPGFEATLELPPVSIAAERLAFVAWISARGEQAPIQAVGGFL